MFMTYLFFLTNMKYTIPNQQENIFSILSLIHYFFHLLNNEKVWLFSTYELVTSRSIIKSWAIHWRIDGFIDPFSLLNDWQISIYNVCDFIKKQLVLSFNNLQHRHEKASSSWWFKISLFLFKDLFGTSSLSFTLKRYLSSSTLK